MGEITRSTITFTPFPPIVRICSPSLSSSANLSNHIHIRTSGFRIKMSLESIVMRFSLRSLDRAVNCPQNFPFEYRLVSILPFFSAALTTVCIIINWRVIATYCRCNALPYRSGGEGVNGLPHNTIELVAVVICATQDEIKEGIRGIIYKINKQFFFYILTYYSEFIHMVNRVNFNNYISRKSLKSTKKIIE